MAAELIGIATLLLLFWQASSAASAPPGDPILPGCVAHGPLNPGDVDYADDYHCAGLALPFHTAGVARSPGLIWAGQWLFVDDAGNYRIGTCTFNRGIHPAIDGHSTPTQQTFPIDPSGAQRAYLTWRYGRTTDGVMAAAMWAVMHYYAQDAAGSNRADNATSPLVPSLMMIGEATGRPDVEDLAISLVAEAARYTSPMTMTVALGQDGIGAVQVLAGTEPVGAIGVRLQVTGAAPSVMDVVTDAAGRAAFQLSDLARDVVVTATASGPGSAQVYIGAAAESVYHLPQTLITSGPAAELRAEAAVTIEPPTTTTEPAPTTTTTTTTTQPATTTTQPATTTTALATTTTAVATTTTAAVTTTTAAATTTTAAVTTTETTSTTEAVTTVVTTDLVTTTELLQTEIETVPTVAIMPFAPPEALDLDIPSTTLPETGSSNSAAYLGTALLVAGIGIVGAVRRRLHVDPGTSLGVDADTFW